MNFFLPDLFWDRLRRTGFTGTIHKAIANLASDPRTHKYHDVADIANSLMMESDWISATRPYYKVWPSLVDSLSRVRLDIAPQEAQIPGGVICLRFAASDPRFAEIRTILCRQAALADGKPCLFISWGQCPEKGKPPRGGFLTIPLWTGTISEGLEELVNPGCDMADPSNLHLGIDERDRLILRLCVAVCLLAHDPSIVQPDVLADDRRRFDESTDPAERQRLVDKARKRGIVGWRIGEEYETIPHIRRPHFALFHTGKGRTVPRILPVKGCVVHRQKLTEVPTGYILPDGREIEP